MQKRLRSKIHVIILVLVSGFLIAILVGMVKIIHDTRETVQRDSVFFQQNIFQQSAFINKSIATFVKLAQYKLEATDITPAQRGFLAHNKAILAQFALGKGMNMAILERLPEQDPLLLRDNLLQLISQLNDLTESITNWNKQIETARSYATFVTILENYQAVIPEILTLLHDHLNLHTQIQSLFFTGLHRNMDVAINQLDTFLHILSALAVLEIMLVAVFLAAQQQEIRKRRRAEQALTHHQEHLEALVQERTAKLAQEIADRRQTEEALQESQNRLALIFNSINEYIVFLKVLGEHEYQIESCNEPFIRANQNAGLQICAKDLFGMNVTYFLREVLQADQSKIELSFQKYQEAIATGRKVQYEETTRFPDSLVIISETTLIPILNDQGHCTHLLYVTRDITERKRTEETLREEHQLLSSIFNASPMGMFCLDRDAQVTLWGPAAEQMFGWKTEEVVGTFNPIVPAEKMTEFLGLFNAMLEGGSMLSREVRRQRKNGSVIDIHLSVAPLRRANGKIMGALGMFIDITERKQAEEALRDSEEKFRTIFEMSLSMICIADIQTKMFLKINPAFIAVLGYQEKELLQHSMFDFIHPDDRAVTHEIIEKELQKGKKVLSFINRYRCKDGTYRWFDWASHPNPDKGVTYAIAYDITDRKHAETEIRRFNAVLEQRVVERTAELEAANKELERFAYVTSHDLKAPLRGINQLTAWLMTDYASVLDAEGQKLCTLLSGRVKRMDALIDGILLYSRIGRIKNISESVALTTIIQNALDMLIPPETIRLTIPPDLPVVRGDRIRLTQVFQNLLSNALNFMDKPNGCITMGCRDNERFWTLSVSDNGPGIPPQYHDRIFQIFQTLHARDEHESTGIGLAIAKKIVELHGGTIWVESVPGQGSTFFFTLPKTSDAALEVEHEECQSSALAVKDKR